MIELKNVQLAHDKHYRDQEIAFCERELKIKESELSVNTQMSNAQTKKIEIESVANLLQKRHELLAMSVSEQDIDRCLPLPY